MTVTKKGVKVKVKIAALNVDGTGHSEGTVLMVPEAEAKVLLARGEVEKA